MAVAILNLLWLPAILYFDIAIPDKILTVPILVAFVVSLAHFATLYRLRVAIPISQMVGAAVAAMSVQWTVARAVGLGLWKDSLPFRRTANGKNLGVFIFGAPSEYPDPMCCLND